METEKGIFHGVVLWNDVPAKKIFRGLHPADNEHLVVDQDGVVLNDGDEFSVARIVDAVECEWCHGSGENHMGNRCRACRSRGIVVAPEASNLGHE